MSNFMTDLGLNKIYARQQFKSRENQNDDS